MLFLEKGCPRISDKINERETNLMNIFDRTIGIVTRNHNKKGTDYWTEVTNMYT